MSTPLVETEGVASQTQGMPAFVPTCLVALRAQWDRADATWYEREAAQAISRGWFRIITDRTGRDLYLLRCWRSQPIKDTDGKWESAASDLLHFFPRPDTDPCLHDHPWDFETEILEGGYVEYVPPSTWSGRIAGKGPAWNVVQHHRKPGDRAERLAEDLHCVGRLLIPGRCWTRVRTGARRRNWGFHPPGQPWMTQDAYLAMRKQDETERVVYMGPANGKTRALATVLLLVLCWLLPAQDAPPVPEGFTITGSTSGLWTIVNIPQAVRYGRWLEVTATAYSPLDALTRDDSGNPKRMTAMPRSSIAHPYGIAVPLIIGGDGMKRPLYPYGTRIEIPRGQGYLDDSGPADRVFVVDDTGSIITERTRESGLIHLDLRYRTAASAQRFGVRRLLMRVLDDRR